SDLLADRMEPLDLLANLACQGIARGRRVGAIGLSRHHARGASGERGGKKTSQNSEPDPKSTRLGPIRIPGAARWTSAGVIATVFRHGCGGVFAGLVGWVNFGWLSQTQQK